jgi:hypothetical protein
MNPITGASAPVIFLGQLKMKILFTADLHIRIGQKNIPKEWAINQYRIMF